jgi:7,8-dihydropterin-6-yl-methyl-4-(beta-D-ribofuranosyl)aminobenzene 5'-phosphate synthase
MIRDGCLLLRIAASKRRCNVVRHVRYKLTAAATLILVLMLAVCCKALPRFSIGSPGSQPPQRASLTIVYDNNAYDPRLRAEWGFACWVEYGDTVLLFDTGGDGTILLDNMQTLGLDPQQIDVVVLSHIHGDHTGGLEQLLGTGVRPDVYLPSTFPTQYKNELRERVTVHEVSEPQEILPGILSTGKMGLNVPEQGLVLKTSCGLVVITGCAHPGIVDMLSRAKEVGRDDLYLVVGGFHLAEASSAAVRQICEDFRELGVQTVAPSHCTGEEAIGIFASEFGKDWLSVGVGWGIGFCSPQD